MIEHPGIDPYDPDDPPMPDGEAEAIGTPVPEWRDTGDQPAPEPGTSTGP